MPRKSKKKQRFKESAVLINVKDFFIDTADFTAAETGYYFKLLCMQWANKTIPADPIRLEIAVGERTTIPVRNEGRDEFVNVPNSVPFLQCWEHIKTKFVPAENGGLVNLRMEEERAEFMEYQQAQADRTKKATAARMEKQRNEERNVPRNDERDEFRNDDVTSDVTRTNTNTNTNTNYSNNNIGGDHVPGSDKNKKNNLTAAPGAKFFTMREISLQRGNSGPLRLHLYLDDTYTSKEIEALLAQNLESLVMQDDIWKKPEALQALVFETYFMEKVAAGQDTSAGKLRKDFIFWFRNNFRHIEKKYNNSLKDIEWFNSEVVKANGVCKDDEQRKQFIEYYLTPLPSGQLYYQTLHNFSVKESLARWAKKDFKSYTKLKASLPAGTVIIPGADSSIEELNNHYKLE